MKQAVHLRHGGCYRAAKLKLLGVGRVPSGSTPQRITYRQCGGFTLLEMIVATAILSMAIVGLLTLTSTVLANAARVRQYDRAAMLARTTMNQLLVEDPLPLGTELRGSFDKNSGWEARVEPFRLPRNPRPGRTMLVRIILSIWWRADGRRKQVELESYRRMIIRPEHDIVAPSREL